MVKNSLTMTVEDGIATLIIDIPGKPMNVVTPDLRRELSDAIGRLRAETAIKGAIVTSGKNDFMAGGDLKVMLERFERQLSAHDLYENSRLFGDILRHLETCGKPVAAAINGLALGGGFELALSCHYRVLADLPKIVVGLPEATLGLMPGAGGTQRLTRMLGAAAAIPLLLEGRALAPAEALAARMVDAVVPAEQLLDAAKKWLAGNPEPIQRWEKQGHVVPGGTTLGTAPLGPLYNVAATGIARDTQRNRPAPIAILTAVARGLPMPIDAGLRIERCEFVKLLMNPVTRNIIRTQFVSKGEAEKLARRPVGMVQREYKKIGVLGAGLMGSGIAQIAALAGIDVALIDSSQESAEKGLGRIGATFEKLVGRGKMTAEKAAAALARIQATCEYERLAGSGLIIEAVFENRAVKTQVLSAAHRVLGDEAIYASNTSTIPITSLAGSVGRPDRVIGMHFFSPVDRMALVEVVKGRDTGAETLAHALDFVKQVRKTPIVVNDSRGFFTSRVFSTYLSEAMGMLAEGVDPALIENGARQAGFPIGPLTLIDEVTIELGFAAANQARADLGDAWIEPPGYPVQKLFVEELDRKGRRYGKGFYEYPAGSPKRLWPGLAKVYPRKRHQPSLEEVKQRLLCIQALEATRCLEQGVLESVAEGDLGSTLGIGYPVYTGGVFSLIDTMGLAKFVETCRRFAACYGKRWTPSDSLVARAAAGDPFYPKSIRADEAAQA